LLYCSALQDVLSFLSSAEQNALLRTCHMSTSVPTVRKRLATLLRRRRKTQQPSEPHDAADEHKAQDPSARSSPDWAWIFRLPDPCLKPSTPRWALAAAPVHGAHERERVHQQWIRMASHNERHRYDHVKHYRARFC
jgi:hypothetical protein